MKQPNILLIMTDQQRADSLGCYGVDWIPTPNLDRLAAEGTRFDSCTVNNPICTPSRASMMTGKELPGHSVYRLHDILPDTEVLFPERLRSEAGYRTALFGKLHVSGRATEDKRRHPHDGFETYEWCIESCVSMESRFNGYVSWLRDRDPGFLADLRARKRKVKHHPEEVHFTRWAADRTADFIRENAAGSDPFFCMMSLFDPHNPYEDYPSTMTERIDRGRIPKPITSKGLPKAAKRERDGSYLGRNINETQIEDMRFGYAASIAFLDQEIGKVLAVLDETNIAEDTLVIFTSDHGDSLGDHGMMVKGVALYEPVIKVPLILRWPGNIAQGQTCGALAQGHDLATTCLAAAGLERGEETGLDWIAMAAGAEARRTAFSAYRNSGINNLNDYWDPPMNSTAALNRTGKLIAYASGTETEYEYFDFTTDPEETTNRFHDPEAAAAIRPLFEDLTAWLQQEGAGAGSRGGSQLLDDSSFMENALDGAVAQ
jgi:arylsulfatase